MALSRPWTYLEGVSALFQGATSHPHFQRGCRMFRRCAIVSGILCLAFSSVASLKAEVLADSVADFSGTQGTDSWYYGYYDGSLTPATFTLISNYDPTFNITWPPTGGAWTVTPSSQWGPGGYWTCLWADGGHPNGTNGNQGRLPIEQWAVRRWVSDVSGEVTISGFIASLGGGNMMASVFVDGKPLFSQQIPSNKTSYEFLASVAVGSTVDFVIAPNNHNDVDGSSEFTGVVNYVPEPSTLVLLGIGAISLLVYAWRAVKVGDWSRGA